MTHSAAQTAAPIAPGTAFSVLPVPEGVEVLTIEVSIGKLTALRACPSTARRGVALFIPGYTGSKEDFYPMLPRLAAKGWEVWAYSQRGQADSVAPKGVESYTRQTAVRDALEVTRAVLAATGTERLHLLGHSYGGTIAQGAVIAKPGLFASLSLMCSGPHGWPGRHAADRDRLLSHPGADFWTLDHPGVSEEVVSRMSSNERYLRDRARQTSPEELLGVIEQLADVRDHSFELRQTGVPALVFHGQDDLFSWPQEWQRRQARILGARYEVVAEAGHCVNTDQPAAAADLLDDFWAGLQ